MIDLSGIVVICGNYGSGKTEVAINLAAYRQARKTAVTLVDLDLVNPYFRSREAAKPLSGIGVRVVMPPSSYFHADLPILSPEAAGVIQQSNKRDKEDNKTELVILDAGGDDAGATVLSALADAFEGRAVQMLQVINPHRPRTDTPKGCIRVGTEIEHAAGLAVTGLIGNAHLMDRTTEVDIYAGHDFARRVSEKNGRPLIFVTAPESIYPRLDLSRFSCPVLPICRRLVFPWQKRPDRL